MQNTTKTTNGPSGNGGPQSKQVTRSKERFHTKMDWLDSRHSFSFGGHYDPDRTGFGPLRVVNDDWISPGGGFPPHPHKDMEIISIVLHGQLQHKDSLGNGSIIKPGEIQYMSAGKGVVHSEFNPSEEEATHLMQIWIHPNEEGLDPRYADQELVGSENNEWSLILSPDGRNRSMEIRQDAYLSTVQLDPGKSVNYRAGSSNRGFWLFVIAGEIQVAENSLATGDALALSGIDDIKVTTTSQEPAKILLFDLPM